MEQLRYVLNYTLLTLDGYALSVKAILIAIGVLVFTRVLITALKRFILQPFFRRNGVDLGRSYAVTQIIAYILYTAGLIAALGVLGIQFSVLWGAAAALLVGIGLGLQQTFNDFFSGLLLLIEGPVEVGNVVEVDGFIGRVVEIGLRTSRVRTRDDIMIIVPNSHLVNDNIINWSAIRSPLRFYIDVGVAYGTDTALVRRTLEEAADDHEDVLERPVPRVMFTDFGDSSLNFRLYFYSQEPWKIEFIKSDMRFAVDALFRERGIAIPFPQRDLWLRTPAEPASANGETETERLLRELTAKR